MIYGRESNFRVDRKQAIPRRPEVLESGIADHEPSWPPMPTRPAEAKLQG